MREGRPVLGRGDNLPGLLVGRDELGRRKGPLPDSPIGMECLPKFRTGNYCLPVFRTEN